MKKVLLSLLIVVLVLGALGAVGFAGYRFGYTRGVQAAVNGQMPEWYLFDDISPHGGPRFEREFGLHREFGARDLPARGIDVYLLRMLIPLAALLLTVLFAYWLFTRSGWQLTRTHQATEAPAQPVEEQRRAGPHGAEH